MRLRYGFGEVHGLRGVPSMAPYGIKITPYVEFYTQPLPSYLRYRLFHRYHMLAARSLPRWALNLLERNDMPWRNAQDVRCHHLKFRNRTEVSRVELNDDEYALLRGKR